MVSITPLVECRRDKPTTLLRSVKGEFSKYKCLHWREGLIPPSPQAKGAGVQGASMASRVVRGRALSIKHCKTLGRMSGPGQRNSGSLSTRCSKRLLRTIQFADAIRIFRRYDGTAPPVAVP